MKTSKQKDSVKASPTRIPVGIDLSEAAFEEMLNLALRKKNAGVKMTVKGKLNFNNRG